MKSLWSEASRRELTARLDQLSPTAPAQWGKMNASWGVLGYHHIDHHFKQFGA